MWILYHIVQEKNLHQLRNIIYIQVQNQPHILHHKVAQHSISYSLTNCFKLYASFKLYILSLNLPSFQFSKLLSRLLYRNIDYFATVSILNNYITILYYRKQEPKFYYVQYASTLEVIKSQFRRIYIRSIKKNLKI